MNTAKTYPDIAQSFGIAGIMILTQLLVSPLGMLQLPVDKEVILFLTYTLSIGAAAWIAHVLRKSKSGITTYPLFIGNSKPWILLFIFGIAFPYGVSGPLSSAIPLPDFMRDIFLELMSNEGILAFVTLAVAAPILEELIFRGIVLDGLLKRYSPVKAILVSSFLFGIVHMNPWQFVSAFLIGIFMGWVYWKSGNLALTIFIHFVNNAFASLLSGLYDAEAMLNQPFVTMYGSMSNMLWMIPLAIAICLGCFFLLKKEFDKNPLSENMADS